MYSLLLYIITRTARHGVSNTPEHSNHIYMHMYMYMLYMCMYLPNSSLIGGPRRRGMAASSPLHRDAFASRQPSSHSLHCFTATNAALSSHKIEGLVAGCNRGWAKTGRKRKLLIDGFVASPPELLRVSEFQTHLCTRLVCARGSYEARAQMCLDLAYPWRFRRRSRKSVNSKERNLGPYKDFLLSRGKF